MPLFGLRERRRRRLWRVRSFQRWSEAIFASSAARAIVNASEPRSRRSGGSSTWVICIMASAALNGSLRGVPDAAYSAISPKSSMELTLAEARRLTSPSACRDVDG
jgi:hypothetical protein